VKKLIRFLTVTCSVFTLTTLTAHAASFGNFDPRSLAMGGTGVSSSTSSNASYYNPAVLSMVQQDDDFSLTAPIVGIRGYDPKDMLDSFEAYQDGQYETAFSNSIDAFNASPSTATAGDAATKGQQLLNGLISLSNKELDFEVHGGLNLAIPGKGLGMAVHASVRGMGGLVLNISSADTTVMQTYIDTLNVLAGGGSPGANAVFNGTTFTLPSMTSDAHILGVSLIEGGLSLSHEFDIFGGVSIGITPKVVQVTTFDYVVGIETANTSTEASKRTYDDTNLDVGIAKQLSESWKFGMVTKNIMAKDYDTALGNTIKIKPQTRVGLSHHTNWSTFALDMDLTENESIGLTGQKTKYLAFGMELDLSLLQLRAGIRRNLAATGAEVPDVLSAGVGLYLLGAHVDIGVAGNEDEIEAAVQLGLQF